MSKKDRMKRIGVSIVTIPVLVACASTTVLNSVPPGAKVYLNDEPVGTTPYTLSDTKTFWSKTSVRLEAQGYETFTATLNRNEEFQAGACLGGVLVGFPFLWIMGYKPEHTYELHTSAAFSQNPPAAPTVVPPAAIAGRATAIPEDEIGKPCQPVPGMAGAFKCSGGLVCREGICERDPSATAPRP